MTEARTAGFADRATAQRRSVLFNNPESFLF